jgi:predicted methyltransferase
MGRSYHERRKDIKKGDVYFVKIGDYYKIGATRHLYSRLIGLQTGMPTKIELIHSIKTSDMNKTERLFQAMFERNNKLERGEWFKLTDADIAYIKAGRYSKAIMDSIGDMREWTRGLEVVGELLAI